MPGRDMRYFRRTPFDPFSGGSFHLPGGFVVQKGRRSGLFLPNGIPEKTLPIEFATDDSWLDRECWVKLSLRKDEVWE